MPDRPLNVLFLCTGNSARSLMAEALLRREAPDRFRGFSAGSQPKPKPHPYTLDQLNRSGHETGFVRSKSWEEFATADAPPMDVVITVCDNAASEVCPIWPGTPVCAHWSLPDPAAVTGSEAEQRLAFAEAYRILRDRIAALANLSTETGDPRALRDSLDAIGRGEMSAEPPDG